MNPSCLKDIESDDCQNWMTEVCEHCGPLMAMEQDDYWENWLPKESANEFNPNVMSMSVQDCKNLKEELARAVGPPPATDDELWIEIPALLLMLFLIILLLICMYKIIQKKKNRRPCCPDEESQSGKRQIVSSRTSTQTSQTQSQSQRSDTTASTTTQASQKSSSCECPKSRKSSKCRTSLKKVEVKRTKPSYSCVPRSLFCGSYRVPTVVVPADESQYNKTRRP